MKYLLSYIRGWAEQYPTYASIEQASQQHLQLMAESELDLMRDGETEYLQVYNTLLKENVAFPSKELFK